MFLHTSQALIAGVTHVVRVSKPNAVSDLDVGHVPSNLSNHADTLMAQNLARV